MSFYSLTYAIGFVCLFVLNFLQKKKFEFKTIEVIIISFVTYIFGVVGAMIAGRLYGFVMQINGLPGTTNVAISGAIMFTPVLLIIFAVLAKKDWKKVLDICTPGIYAILGWAKIGCFSAGCCHGVVSKYGVYNETLQATVFPIQIVEAIVTFVFVIISLIYVFKSKKRVTGTMYPLITIAYTAFRFVVEYFRYYELEAQRHVIFGMFTLWQFCCIFMFVISIIWIIVLKKKSR